MKGEHLGSRPLRDDELSHPSCQARYSGGMGYVKYRNCEHLRGAWNSDIARDIYTRAARTAAGNQEVFERLVVDGLKRAGLAIPKKFAAAAASTAATAAARTATAAAARTAAATTTSARTAAQNLAKGAIAATAAAAATPLAPVIFTGAAAAGVVALGVLAWRRWRK